jgi:NAD(P)-dependent dehydrogenase (short-subunit alcohol dehydrogenase family)
MGLIGLARGLASEFAPHNIRVNVVSPGRIDTRRDNPEWYGNRPPNADGILWAASSISNISARRLAGPLGPRL